MAYGSQGVNNGAVLDGTVDRELYQQKAATDVLKYFMDTNVAKELITNDSIENGKSKAFPIVGNATAASRDEETLAELSLDSIKATERVISIGDLTVAHSWISDLDSAMVHYNSASAQIESIGRALAKKVDEDVIAQVIVAGAIDDASAATSAGLRTFSDDVFTVRPASPVIVSATGVASGVEVYTAMAAAMTEFRSKDAVGEPVYLVRPQQYFALLNNPASTGLTWVNDPFAQTGKVPMVLGAKVVYTPHFAAFVSTASATNDIGVLFAKECVGALELLSVSIRTDYIPQRLADLMVGKMAIGYGVLNHGSAINMRLTNAA
tara:strand:- start:1182 stop:2147 length:966 start_codon:yes stop_codon:yes gene_type:complete